MTAEQAQLLIDGQVLTNGLLLFIAGFLCFRELVKIIKSILFSGV